MIEEGAHHPVSSHTDLPYEAIGRLYRDKGFTTTIAGKLGDSYSDGPRARRNDRHQLRHVFSNARFGDRALEQGSRTLDR